MKDVITGPERYGQFYWCVGLSDGKEVYANADETEITDAGALALWRTTDPGPDFARVPAKARHMTLAFAPGRWVFVYAASVIDGHAVAANHWEGQILEQGI